MIRCPLQPVQQSEKFIPGTDSFVARKLREAGAVIIANLTLVNGQLQAKMSSSGWSGVGGQTKTRMFSTATLRFQFRFRCCCFCQSLHVAIGTETTDLLCALLIIMELSVLSHSGLISRTGIVPISFSQDTLSDGTDSGDAA